MTSDALVSIIVPVYNVEKYIQRCLDSLLVQTYKRIEILLVNDGSTDHSLAICERNAEKDDRIRVYTKPNGGLSDARNFGILKSEGEWLSFVDSDDYVDSDYIEYLYSILQNGHASMAICQHRVVFSSGKVHTNLYRGRSVIDAHTALERMLYHDGIDTSACAKLYPKKYFDKVSFPKGKLFEDIATTYKTFLLSDRIAVGEQAKYNYMFRTDSIVNNDFSPQKIDLISMTESMATDVESVYPDLKQATLRRIIYAYISTLNQMRGSRKHLEMRNEIISKIRRYRKSILSDRRAPFRDKAAVMLISVNYLLYAKTWQLYLRLKKGES